MGVCNCSMFCCTLLYVHSSIAIILIGKRELVDLLNLSSWCLVMVEWLFLAVPWGCLRLVIVVFSDHIHLLFLLHLQLFDCSGDPDQYCYKKPIFTDFSREIRTPCPPPPHFGSTHEDLHHCSSTGKPP